MPVRTEWHGDELSQRVQAACVAGVNDATAAAVERARALVHVDTGALRDSLAATPATERGGQIVGSFGSDVDYALLQEILPEPRGKAYLRPAGDEQVRQLPERVRSHLQ